jgi:hypothetical protein
MQTIQDFKGQKRADDIVRVVLITSTVCALRCSRVEAN